MPDEEYIPYGDEWEKEMKNFSKAALITMLGKALKGKHEAIERIESLNKHFKKLIEKQTIGRKYISLIVTNEEFIIKLKSI